LNWDLSSTAFSTNLVILEKTASTHVYFIKVRGFIDNGLEKLHSVLVPERRKACHHFMNETTEAPPIYVDTMAHLFNDLWRQILRSTTNRCGRLFLAKNFGQSKICEFDIPDSIDDDVLGLEANLGRSYSR